MWIVFLIVYSLFKIHWIIRRIWITFDERAMFCILLNHLNRVNRLYWDLPITVDWLSQVANAGTMSITLFNSNDSDEWRCRHRTVNCSIFNFALLVIFSNSNFVGARLPKASNSIILIDGNSLWQLEIRSLRLSKRSFTL